MPQVVARQARAQGRKVLAVAIRGITDPALGEIVDDLRWLEWGDVGGFLKLLREYRDQGVRDAVMAGKVEQQRIYQGGGDDAMGRFLEAIPVRHTDALIRGVADLLGGMGIRLVECTGFLDGYLVAEGVLTRRSPNPDEEGDIEHGWQVAKALGKLDIGQTVVVKGKAVVAVEAMEGTDACIRRAGQLAGPGTVVVKAAKPGQDHRFDLPVIGAGTVGAMVEAKATALAVEAGVTVAFDRDALKREADAAAVAIVARRGG